ncbi:hypothetical protein BCV70DRAFT_207115 [Testicularia cyperi]|uniref:Uncharacterized protein n=1 Tax=Testicularia cyperi TaxID=1882483 RepID=A0A317XN70_9BASI|nr:hypothetical protein BCV70DRAFT_207115 [Testicularia cyperi]
MQDDAICAPLQVQSRRAAENLCVKSLERMDRQLFGRPVDINLTMRGALGVFMVTLMTLTSQIEASIVGLARLGQPIAVVNDPSTHTYEAVLASINRLLPQGERADETLVRRFVTDGYLRQRLHTDQKFSRCQRNGVVRNGILTQATRSDALRATGNLLSLKVQASIIGPEKLGEVIIPFDNPAAQTHAAVLERINSLLPGG